MKNNLPLYPAVLTLLAACILFVTCSRGGLQPRGLQTATTESVLGHEWTELSFSWEVPDKYRQSAFQVLVASDEDKLAANVGDLWDSGKRYGKESAGLRYAGTAIKPGSDAWWKVRIWDEDGVPGDFSARARFAAPSAGKNDFRIALLGGTFISDMAKYGFLETALTIRWPQQNLIFRNLGWPGDDVFGTARSEFGSAQNTRSWKPPTAEEGFGNAVMLQQVRDAAPGTLLVGYGREVAFAGDDEALRNFELGYRGLLTSLDSLGADIILLTPPRHQPHALNESVLEVRNQKLRLVAELIEQIAAEKGYGLIDLYNRLITEDPDPGLTENGQQLSTLGHRKLAGVVLEELGLMPSEEVEVAIGEDGGIALSREGSISQVSRTGKSTRFNLRQDRLRPFAKIAVSGEHLLKIDGEIVRERIDDPAFTITQDSIQYERLRQTIIEKNRLHRYRINPLNKAYIFLFRQHEMGHLAYEMEDFDRLVEEQEELIAQLRVPAPHRYEVERLEPWKAPRDYPDHEVPRNVPEPDVVAELKAFEIAPGFEMNLFAADPMIANPIYMTWDHRGRAWVSTSSTYPHIKPGREPNDKIVILEDVDGDGRADKSTVFAEDLLIPHSVMPVEGGAFVCSTTELLFLADTDGDDRADSRRVVYSGFGNADVHHTIHGFQWTPWGDLLFTQSIYINTFLQTPYGSRRMNGSGVWRFRPESESLDPWAYGRVNPWGLAFDDWGQAFGTDGAGAGGAHYVFPGSAHVSAVGFDRILDGLQSGKPKNTAAEFITGRHLPARWRGSLLANDFRANRTVRYEIREKGSGYTAEEVETVLHSSHRSYRPVDVKMGPEGAVYIVDWYNPIIDHGEVDFHHPLRDKSHGRIWRLTARNRPLVARPEINIAGLPALFNMLKLPEQYTRLQANRELVRRKCSLLDIRNWTANLKVSEPGYNHHRLEALWLSAAINNLDFSLLTDLLSVRDHRVRAAATRMITLVRDEATALSQLGKMVVDDHPRVRLEAVNALREIMDLQAVETAFEALEMPVDPNLEFALWSIARSHSSLWLKALEEGKPVFDDDLHRQVFGLKAANNQSAVKAMADLFNQGKLGADLQQDALVMMAQFGGNDEVGTAFTVAVAERDREVLRALFSAPAANKAVPVELDGISTLLAGEDAALQELGANLAGRWRVESVRDELLAILSAEQTQKSTRMAAAAAVASIGDFSSLEGIARQHENPEVKIAATVAWAAQQPEAAVENAVALLQGSLSESDAGDLFNTYTRREEGPALLAGALEGKELAAEIAVAGVRASRITGRDLTVLIEALNDAGDLKPLGQQLTPDERQSLLAETETKGNAGRGRQIYYREGMLCMTCHKLGNTGGKLGPDLTTLGSYMTPESILESLVNPSTAIKQGYETMIVTLTNGDIVTGVLERKTGDGVLIRDPSDQSVLISNADIQTMDSSPVSLMPAGLTAGLRRDELVDLLRFLTGLGRSEAAGD